MIMIIDYDMYEADLENALVASACEEEDDDFLLTLDDLYGMEIYAATE